jgi:hypothetical protein
MSVGGVRGANQEASLVGGDERSLRLKPTPDPRPSQDCPATGRPAWRAAGVAVLERTVR